MADLSTWDMELLPIELAELQGMDFDLGRLGFSEDDLATLLDPGVKDGLTVNRPRSTFLNRESLPRFPISLVMAE